MARRFKALAPLAIASLLVLPTRALAAWALSGAGTAAGGTTTMPTGTAPTGVGGANDAALSWAPATLRDGAAVEGYLIHRYDAATGALEGVDGGCAGLVGATSCVATSIPAGTWLFTVTPVQGNWTGGESPDSAPVTVHLG